MAIQGAMQVQIPASAVGANGYTFTINWPLAGVDLTTADTLSGNIRLTETGDPFPISGVLTATGPNTLTWKLHSSDTLTQGTAEVQFRATFGTDNIISAPSKWLIYNTLSGALPPPDPSAVSFIRNNGDGTYSFLNAADFRTAIGAGTGDGDMPLVDPAVVGNLVTLAPLGDGSLVDAGQAGGMVAGEGGAIGRNSQSDNGGAIGENAITLDGASVGGAAQSNHGGAIGRLAATNDGGAIGDNSFSVDGFAGGKNASASGSDSIQLGAGTNPTAGTFQVYTHQFLDASGNIPAARMTTNLGTAAVEDATAFDAAGSAAGVQGNLNTHTGDATIHFTQAAISITPAQAGADPAGSAATVQDNLDTHTGLTTTAHGGIVADSDARLTDARTPTAHASTHASAGSDPLTPADIGAEVEGTTATHAALEGTAVHGLGTAALLTSTAVGEDLVTAVDVNGARAVLGLARSQRPSRNVDHAQFTFAGTNVLGSATLLKLLNGYFQTQTGTTAESRIQSRTNSTVLMLNHSINFASWVRKIGFGGYFTIANGNPQGVFRAMYGKLPSDGYGIVASGNYVGWQIENNILTQLIACRAGALESIAVSVSLPAMIWAVSQNGSVSWYANSLIIGETSNGPIQDAAGGSITFEINNGTTGAEYRLRYTSFSEGY